MNSMNRIIEKYGLKEVIRFIITFVIYISWVIWLGNYWFLLGAPIIVDIYLTKKVNWTPWKKREGKNHWFIEWLDALIFAVVAVTIINIFLFQNYKIPTGSMEKSLMIGDYLYVSKVAFGPRLPITPLSIPFMQNTIPGTTLNSYSDILKWSYRRIGGFGKIKRDEPVVFNFPEGDTVCAEKTNVSYYLIIREEAEELKRLDQEARVLIKSDEIYYELARKKVREQYNIVYRPIDKQDNYIKRCVAIAGDSLQIIDGTVYINGVKERDIPGIQYVYIAITNGQRLNPKKLQQLGISPTDVNYSPDRTLMQVPLTAEMAQNLKKTMIIKDVERYISNKNNPRYDLFPLDARYPWNLDQFGPIYIPKKGATIRINLDNISFYKRIISLYENNDLKIKDGKIYINGELSDTYTFKMNYYWMMGDNRHGSYDSRYWGYVPEDHIVGSPRFVWLSLDKDRSFPANIRFSRMFRMIQ
jgi:signal peptidase I